MPQFSKSNQPTRRKGGTPPPVDTPEGLDPAAIDRLIEEPEPVIAKKVHLPLPRPHSLIPAAIEAARGVPKDVPDIPLDQAQADLAEIQQAARERAVEIAAEQKQIEAETLAARQRVDKAKRTIEEQRIAERAHQIQAEARAMAGLGRERREEDARREQERKAAFVDRIERDLLPVTRERQALTDFEARYVPTLQDVEKKKFSQTPITLPYPLRVRFDALAIQAHSILAGLRRSIFTVDKVLQFGGRLLVKGSAIPHELAEWAMLLKSGTGHRQELWREMENLIRFWSECIDEAKRYGGATESQPQPTVHEDRCREAEREHHLSEVAGHGGVVRDGAHAPESRNDSSNQVRADPGRIDPVRDLPGTTKL